MGTMSTLSAMRCMYTITFDAHATLASTSRCGT